MAPRVRACLADRERLAFVGCIALHLLPIWGLDHFPSQDGPSHVANASVLRDYGRPDRALLREYYSLNWWPNPNWLGHFVMAALMVVVPPVTAEKLLLTGYVAGLPLAVRYALGALDPASRPLAFLAFPFVYNYALHMGFYNFSLGLPLFFLTVGYWLAHGGRLGLRRAVVLQLLSLLLYFSHPLGLGAAWLAIAVLGLHGLAVELIERRRERALSAVVLRGSIRARVLAPGFAASPAAVLAALYLLEGRPGSAAPFRPDFGARVDRLIRLEPLLSHTPVEGLPAAALAGLFGAALLYVALRRMIRRDLPRRDALLLVTAVYLVGYFTLPDAMAGGGFILSRLGLFPYFGLILWLGAQTFSPRARRAIGWGAAVIACVLLVVRAPSYTRLEAYLDEYLSVARHVEPNTALLPISFSCWGDGLEGGALSWRIAVFLHASGYIAAGRGVVVFDNYEANTDLFPTRFRSRVNPYTHIGPERCGGYQVDAPDFLTYPERTAGRLDYVLVWGLTDGRRALPYAQSVLRQLEAGYELIYVSPERGLARLYRRRQAGGIMRSSAPALRVGAARGENSQDAASVRVAATVRAGAAAL